MDLDSIERCWREQSAAPPPPLEEGSVMEMIEAQAVELRKDVRRRLRREAGYYLPMMAVGVASLISAEALTLNRVLAAASMMLMLGGIAATLWLAERRIETAPLDQSLRESLGRLVAQLDAAGRAYLIAYVLVFVCAALALTSVIWWRQGPSAALAVVVAGSVILVAWSVHSGRAYVERMFRRYRAGLADCLRQLDE
jgi:hypothetical protein